MHHDEVEPEKAEPPLTVGQHLDFQIHACRRKLEDLCITKAKAEAAQLLNVPMDFISKISGYPF